MTRRLTITLLFVGSIKTAVAQFTPTLLQNDSYWGGNRAEFDFYDAQIVRDGQPRQCEVVHIFVRESFDSKKAANAIDPKQATVVPVIKLNQILHVPIGVYVHQQMHSTFWRIDNGDLLKWSLTHSDSFGNTFKEVERRGDLLAFAWRTYWEGGSDGSENITPPTNAYFYEELPLRVRTVDFSKPTGEFEIQLAPSVLSAKKDAIVFKPAKVSFTATDRKIDISVKHDAGTDRFALDGDFPFLLREWNAADGSHLKLKNSLRIDYWNYNKNGDRERALKNPMLGHPD